MNKFVIKIGDLYIEINHKYDLVYKMCKDYISDNNKCNIVVKCKKSDIEKYNKNCSIEYAEFLAIYDSIAKELFKFDKLLIHGAAIMYKNKAYLFVAPSGVGKSTHIKLWKDNVKGTVIINGDKPIIDANGYIYGTPWSGKERWNKNIKVKLASIIIINRANKNTIKRIKKEECIGQLLNQIYRNNNLINNIDIFDRAVKNIKFYELSCTKDIEAVKICYNGIIH